MFGGGWVLVRTSGGRKYERYLWQINKHCLVNVLPMHVEKWLDHRPIVTAYNVVSVRRSDVMVP